MHKKSVVSTLNFFLGMIVLVIVSCKKETQPGALPPNAHPEMEYFNLNDTAIKAAGPGFSIDVNHDGRKDLAFTTLLVGDPLNQLDKLQFQVLSNIMINLPVNAREEVPVLSNGDLVPLQNFDGYQWFELSSIMLVQKIIAVTGPVRWEGHWKNAVLKYLPYQVVMNSKRYNGWLALSVDVAGEKILLHRAALSKEADKAITAGR